MINEKFKNIIFLFDEALENIYNNNNIENIKDIYIDINEFKNCNFQKLSPEKRYTVVVLLIDYILPLINEDSLFEKISKKIKNPFAQTPSEVDKIVKRIENTNSYKKITKNGFFDGPMNKRNNSNINKNIRFSQLKGIISYDSIRNNSLISKMKKIV